MVRAYPSSHMIALPLVVPSSLLVDFSSEQNNDTHTLIMTEISISDS